MPELPEVEVTRRSFADRIAGARIDAAALGKPLRWPLGLLPQALVGREVLGVRRRGKYLLVDLSEGLLLIHLGMSGSLRFAGLDEVPLGSAGPHDHFDLQTSQGLLRLHDPRRFGAVIYVPDEGDALARKLLDHLGMEPLSGSFTFDAFKAGLAASRTPIKQLLLIGSVTGAQFGARFAQRVKPEYLRMALAVIVLLVAIRMGVDLFIRPEEIYTVQ